MCNTVFKQISAEGQYCTHNALSCNLSDVSVTFFWEEMTVRDLVYVLVVG